MDEGANELSSHSLRRQGVGGHNLSYFILLLWLGLHVLA